MITIFRNFARSKWAIGFLVLCGFAVVFTGAQMDVFSRLGPKHIISAGARSVDSAQFRQDFDRIRQGASEQTGRAVTLEDLVKENLHVRYLEENTRKLGLLAWAQQAGIRPSKDLVIQQIRKLPAFFSQVSGKFDEQEYQRILAQEGVTPAQLEQELFDQETLNHFGSAVGAGVRLPRVYGAVLASRAMETRDGRWFTVTPAMIEAVGVPTDAQLTAFISENAARLRAPEFRTVSVVLFSDANASNAPIDEARIVERFNFKKDALSLPERRTFVTLTAPNKAAADRMVAALRAGQTPQAVGEANGGVRPADFNETPRAAVTDPAVAAAVFGAQPGQVTDPVQARVGFTVVKVTAVIPAQPATLDSVRSTLVAELRQEDAKAKVFSRVEQYEKARTEGKSLQQAVQDIGARLVSLPPFTQDGRLPNGQQLNAPPQIIENAYRLSKGGESDVIDAGQGQYFVLRLDDVRPSALPSLAEVREPLAREWVARETARRLSAKAEELANRIRSGQDIAAVAASAGASVTSRAGVQQSPASQTELGQGVLQGLFGQGKGQVFSGQGQTGWVIGRVDAVHPAVPALAAPIAEQIRMRGSPEMGNAISELIVAAAAQRTKARNDPAMALQALGVDPATPAAPQP